MLCVASSLINNEAFEYLWTRHGPNNTCTETAQRTSYRNLLVQNKSFTYNTPTKKLRPNSTTADSIQQNYQMNHGNCLNNETQLLHFAALQH